MSDCTKCGEELFLIKGLCTDRDFKDIENFAKTLMKFALIQGSLKKEIINEDDVKSFFDAIENDNLKVLVKDTILN
jgi:hypothetical protein